MAKAEVWSQLRGVDSVRKFVKQQWALAILLALALATASFAGHGNVGNRRSVGGVSISPEGVLSAPQEADLKELSARYKAEMAKVPDALNKPVEMRQVSLKAIEEALAKSDQDLAYYLPDDIRFMAGMQRIQYVFVHPESHDIILAGPGEGWKVDAKGNHVGVTTGRPVLRLEDFMVAMRTVENARNGGITCSIDPSVEGRKQFEAYMSGQKKFSPEVLTGIAQALGQQLITVMGVSTKTRFARTLVSSDFHMKRIAMNLEESPVKGLPSFLDMLKSRGGGLSNMMPRWWLACNYEPMGRSPDGLSWELRGAGVKVMTEDEIIGKDGSVKGSGKTSPVAQEWADLMTKKYDELSVKEPAFGDLRNIMDMCVIAALIAKEDLLKKADCSLPTIATENSGSKVKINENYDAPTRVDTQTSFIKRGKEFIITASGGVEINSWQIADRTVEAAEVGEVRAKAAAKPEAAWYW